MTHTYDDPRSCEMGGRQNSSADAGGRAGKVDRSASHSRGLPIGHGVYHGPGGRRRLGAMIVTCPACLHEHLHRAATLATAQAAVRTGSCGATYTLEVRPALPATSDTTSEAMAA
jgi:hypothetical protein